MELTVKELIEELKMYPAQMVVNFSGLDFCRLKDRGAFLQVEFNQIVFKDSNGDIVAYNP